MDTSSRPGAAALPAKTRELHNWIIDSTRWNGFRFRDDDIVIATWSKSGTTWLQQIIGQLVFRTAEDVPVFDLSPWVDMRILPRDEMLAMLEAQTHRRFMKTHLPIDALVFSPRAKYVYIGRDGRDVLWSWYNHHASFSPDAYAMMNGTPGLVGEPLAPPSKDVVAYFHEWLDRDGYPVWSFWQHVQSWWDVRTLDNVLLVHFNHLKRDLEGEMRRIAAFLEIELENELWPRAVEHCSFDYMKRNAGKLSSMLDVVFVGGGQSFIHKGTNGRWRELLSPADIEKYESIARDRLSADCAHWLETGEIRDG